MPRALILNARDRNIFYTKDDFLKYFQRQFNLTNVNIARSEAKRFRDDEDYTINMTPKKVSKGKLSPSKSFQKRL